MSLRRTASGLASLHLFFGVDCIVFCEGGSPLSEADVRAGGGDNGTLDVFFWASVATYLGAKRKYHFKSVGSKSTLKTIAEDAERMGVASIIVCLDRDYDFHCGRQIQSPRVLYTHGYSWESDAVSEVGLERLFFRLFPKTPESQRSMQEALDHIGNVGRQLVKWCEIEITLSHRGLDLLFIRDKPSACMDLSGASLPTLSVLRIQASLTKVGFSRGPKRHVSIAKEEVFQHVWGKLASRFFYHVFVRLAARYDAHMRVTYDLFMRLMVTEMVESFRQKLCPDKVAHYEAQSVAFT